MIRRLLPLLLAGLVASACTTAASSETPDPSGDPTVPATATPTPPAAAPVAVGWGPDAEPVELPGGWRVRDCEGDAPLLCVERAGEVVGAFHLSSFPLTDELAAAADEAALVAALRAFAESSTASVTEDRGAGCGPDYDVTLEPVTDVRVAGLPGVRYGFAGAEQGRTTELVVSYATVAAGQLWIVVAEAAADDGCMADAELDLFQPAILREFLPSLDRVVAGTPLPDAGDRIEDGTVVGVDGGLDGGLVYVLVDGARHRVQQPRPLTAEDLERQGLREGAPIVRLRAVDGATGSWFAVVPPDGADARLHLVVDGVIHPVVVQQVERSAIEGIPDAPRPLLGNLRPATP